jgi:hypothetical protein
VGVEVGWVWRWSGCGGGVGWDEGVSGQGGCGWVDSRCVRVSLHMCMWLCHHMQQYQEVLHTTLVDTPTFTHPPGLTAGR